MQLDLQAGMAVLVAEGERPTCSHNILFVNQMCSTVSMTDYM